MQVDHGKLWHLRVGVGGDLIKDIKQGKFLSLHDLLRCETPEAESMLSAVEGKDRLVLSFILATSLLHLYQGPWLQKTWSNQDICFLVGSHRHVTLNLTTPFLTASCTDPASATGPIDFNQLHPYPSILALGILLLEISLNTIVKNNATDDEKQEGRHMTINTDWLVASRLFKDWIMGRRPGISNIIPEGLKVAVNACLDVDKIAELSLLADVEPVRQYIFTSIVVPLGTALSTTYNIPLEHLHEEVGKETWPQKPDLFDDYNNKHPLDQ